MLDRRQILTSALFAFYSHSHGQITDPWRPDELLEPARLAAVLNQSGPRPTVICVAFPVLYRQKHIIHAEFAGPGNKPEGINDLKAFVSKLPKDEDLVIYCGCCPMVKCPNIRPAYRALKETGFTHIRVLNIAENFHTDWVSKGYPVEAELGVPVSGAK